MVHRKRRKKNTSSARKRAPDGNFYKVLQPGRGLSWRVVRVEQAEYGDLILEERPGVRLRCPIPFCNGRKCIYIYNTPCPSLNDVQSESGQRIHMESSILEPRGCFKTQDFFICWIERKNYLRVRGPTRFEFTFRRWDLERVTSDRPFTGRCFRCGCTSLLGNDRSLRLGHNDLYTIGYRHEFKIILKEKIRGASPVISEDVWEADLKVILRDGYWTFWCRQCGYQNTVFLGSEDFRRRHPDVRVPLEWSARFTTVLFEDKTDAKRRIGGN